MHLIQLISYYIPSNYIRYYLFIFTAFYTNLFRRSGYILRYSSAFFSVLSLEMFPTSVDAGLTTYV